jgi:hypothetical protein
MLFLVASSYVERFLSDSFGTVTFLHALNVLYASWQINDDAIFKSTIGFSYVKNLYHFIHIPCPQMH